MKTIIFTGLLLFFENISLGQVLLYPGECVTIGYERVCASYEKRKNSSCFCKYSIVPTDGPQKGWWLYSLENGIERPVSNFGFDKHKCYQQVTNSFCVR